MRAVHAKKTNHVIRGLWLSAICNQSSLQEGGRTCIRPCGQRFNKLCIYNEASIKSLDTEVQASFLDWQYSWGLSHNVAGRRQCCPGLHNESYVFQYQVAFMSDLSGTKIRTLKIIFLFFLSSIVSVVGNLSFVSGCFYSFPSYFVYYSFSLMCLCIDFMLGIYWDPWVWSSECLISLEIFIFRSLDTASPLLYFLFVFVFKSS